MHTQNIKPKQNRKTKTQERWWPGFYNIVVLINVFYAPAHWTRSIAVLDWRRKQIYQILHFLSLFGIGIVHVVHNHSPCIMTTNTYLSCIIDLIGDLVWLFLVGEATDRIKSIENNPPSLATFQRIVFHLLFFFYLSASFPSPSPSPSLSNYLYIYRPLSHFLSTHNKIVSLFVWHKPTTTEQSNLNLKYLT